MHQEKPQFLCRGVSVCPAVPHSRAAMAAICLPKGRSTAAPLTSSSSGSARAERLQLPANAAPWCWLSCPYPLTGVTGFRAQSPKISISSIELLLQCLVKPCLPFPNVSQGWSSDLGRGQTVPGLAASPPREQISVQRSVSTRWGSSAPLQRCSSCFSLLPAGANLVERKY